MFSYVVVALGMLLLPKAFVLLTTSVGVYDSWKTSTSEMLVEIDRESQRYWRQLRPDFKTRIRHRWYDFKFTMVIGVFYPGCYFCAFLRIIEETRFILSAIFLLLVYNHWAMVCR